MDNLLDLVADFLSWLAGVIDSAWTALPEPVQASTSWWGALNDWFPVSELAIILGCVAALAAFGWLVKLATKIVDWIPL